MLSIHYLEKVRWEAGFGETLEKVFRVDHVNESIQNLGSQGSVRIFGVQSIIHD